MKVKLADRLGNIKEVRPGFSFLYLIFGPIYSMVKGFVFFSLFALIFTYYLLPIPGMEFFTNLISQTSLPENIRNTICTVLLIFRYNTTTYFWILGIVIFVILRLVNSTIIGRRVIKKLMKKKELLPVEERDARILIKYFIQDIDVELSSSFDIKNSDSYKIAEENWYEDNYNRLKDPNKPIKIRLNTSSNVEDLSSTGRTDYSKIIRSNREKKND